MNWIARAASVALTTALAGCASSLSGTGGTEHYACKAPEGALCTSVSGVYANSIHGRSSPSAGASKTPTSSTAAYGASSIVPGASAMTAAPSGAIRSNARVLRVWIAPWEDSDGDLHEEAVVHVVVDTGRWLIEHVRPASRNRVDGVKAPTASVPDAAPKPSPETSATAERLPVSPGIGLPRSGPSSEGR